MNDDQTITYRLKVELDGACPEVYRLFRVDACVDLAALHHMLQLLMGWKCQHRYAFVQGGSRFGDPEYSENDAAQVRLVDVLSQVGDSITYIYDFDDDWRHTVALQEVDNHPQPYPECTEGSGACPWEGFGGIRKYCRLLGALKDEGHPDYQEALRMLGYDYDPTWFDRREVNRLLRLRFSNDDSVLCLQRVFDEFLRDEKKRLANTTYRRYRNCIDTLRVALNSYGFNHSTISYKEVRSAGSTFCQTAHPDTLLSYLPSFFGYFLPRKFEASETEVRQCGTTIRRLLQWMGQKEILSEQEVKKWRRRVLQMARDGRQAARAGSYCRYWPAISPAGRPDEVIEDLVAIVKTGPGRLKLTAPGTESVGWVTVPARFAQMCTEGMELAAELQRFGDRWYLTDVWTVLP